MFKIVPKQVVREITSSHLDQVTSHDRDEMAIPSYLHHNPLIPWLFWKRYKAIYEIGQFQKESTVLEFGCGTGVFLPTLSSSCKKVYAVDLFPQFAKKLCEKYNLPVSLLNDTGSVKNSSLDNIVAADSLEHLENPTDYLKLFRTKLKTNGSLIVSGPTENLLYKTGRIIAGFGNKGDYHHTNINHLFSTIEQCGFTMEKSLKLPFNISPCLFKVARFVVSESLEN